MKFNARTWKFPENINTDLILPNRAFYFTPPVQARYVFSANRPGWVEQVEEGDIIIAGRNFGMGSSRPAARSLRNLKLSCLVAESINGLFFRNAVNFGFPVMEGDMAEVDFDKSCVRNVRTGLILQGRSQPPSLKQLMEAGGLFQLLESEGYLAPRSDAGRPVGSELTAS